MVKTLINKVIDTFKTGKEKRGKLDLVTAMNDAENRYQGNLDKVYSQAQRGRNNYETLLNKYSQGDILNPEEKKYGFGKKAKRVIAAVVTAVSLAACQPAISTIPDPTPTEQDSGDEGSTSGGTTTPTEPTNPDVKYTVSGYLKDCEKDDINRNGEVVCYVDGKEYSRDIDGNDFSFEVPENSEVELKGTMKEGSVRKSYTRTIRFNDIAENKSEINLRCVPYEALANGSLDVRGREADFKEHMRRVNFDESISQFGLGNTLKKWNHGEVYPTEGRPIFQGIEVDPDNWTDGTPEEIISQLKASGYPNVSNMNIIVGKNHIDENGWIRVIYEHASGGMSPGTIIYDEGKNVLNPLGDGYISYAEIYLNMISGAGSVTGHEEFHGCGQVGHADNEIAGGELFPSLMVYTGSTAPAKPADIKASYIIDEPTYSAAENINDILGL